MNILETMEIVRDYCKLIHAVRAENNIPVSYPLYEAQINTVDPARLTGFCLLKHEMKFIAEETNIEHINPFILSDQKPYETWVTKQSGELQVKVDITQDHYLDRIYQSNREHRKKMVERKKLGLAYS